MGKLQVVASGLDALYLSGHGLVRKETLAELEIQRDLAQAKLPATLQMGPLPFAVAPHGWGRYRYCMEHPIGQVGMTTSRHLPAVRVQPRSEFLHAVGPEKAVATFAELLAQHCVAVQFSVSRVDLYTDVTGLPLLPKLQEGFLCRADARRTYETGGRCSGFDFGTRSGATIFARVYEKLLDIERTGHDWWFEIWGDRFQEGSSVTRIEFEIGRMALSQFGLDSPAQVMAGAGGLWRYCTEDWLTYRRHTADSNRTRWPLAPEWEIVQHAGLQEPEVSLTRLQQRGKAGSLRRLTPGLVGYLVGFAALVGTSDIDDTLAALDGHVRNDEIVRRRRFTDRVVERRAGKIA